MIGGKSNARTTPTALGSMVSAGAYGMVIPQGYGLIKSPFLPIWAADLREGGSGKKFKNKKKGVKTYIENIDLLLGHNPIMGVANIWNNATKIPLNFTSQVFAIGSFGTHTLTVTDSQFYSVIGVSVTTPYLSQTTNDYLSPTGTVVIPSGSFETPMWNLAFNGPDGNDPTGYQYYPFVYIWTPAAGAVVTVPRVPLAIANYTVYYTQKSSVIGHKSPLAYMRLTFEPTLGDGPEYTGSLSTQQVLMPPYAGAGSTTYDLGAEGMIPDVRPEVQFPFGVYPSGDADYADMIEDIIKSGITQVSPADATATLNLQQVQHGAAAFDIPGAVQKKVVAGPVTTIQAGQHGKLTFDLANVAGNILIAYWYGFSSSSAQTISSTVEGSGWTVIDASPGAGSAPQQWIVAYVVAGGCVPGTNMVTIAPADANSTVYMGIAELSIDTFDIATAFTLSTPDETVGSITTTNPVGSTALAFAFTINIGTIPTPPSRGPIQTDPRWAEFMMLPASQYDGGASYIQSRKVYGPTLIQIANDVTGQVNIGATRIVLVAFKQVAPSTIPQPFGNFLDKISMAYCRLQARAYGLWGSLSMQSQKAARDWLTNLYKSMNCAPYFSEGMLKQAPYGETSAVANGAIYIAPTGPTYQLTDLNGDYLGDASKPPLVVNRTPQLDAPAIIQYQIPNRASDYNPVAVTQPDAGALAIQGVRKSALETRDEITDEGIARKLLGIAVRREQYIRNPLSFASGPKMILAEPMDIIEITETMNGLSSFPTRITSQKISAGWECAIECEPYVYGVHSPVPITAATITPNVPAFGADPGPVNTPIIFEPVPRLYSSASQAKLGFAVSAPSADYGGCQVLMSSDGGVSFPPIGAIAGNAATGVTTADWPIASDPDTTNDLPVDLTESLGSLSSYLAVDRDNFVYPCYIATGNATIPYGLLTYNTATLTATNKYTLKATGGGNELRRCVFGAPVPQPGPDVDHPNGSRFAFLGNPAAVTPGVLYITMDPKWIGVTLQFKFLPINTFGNTIADPSTLTIYSFTPIGLPGGGIAQNATYINAPSLALSQTSTTNLVMTLVFTKFSSNAVKYNARSIIAVPTVTVPTWFYVFIGDPSYTGDTGATTNLTVYADTTQAKLGVPGYTYVGAIQALPSSFASAIVLPGGYPPPAANIIGS